MKALSIRQPWAYLIVHGHKDIENREWRSDNFALKFRGEFLIHTGLNLDDDFSIDGLPEAARKIPPYGELPRGGIVGIAEVVDVVKEHSSPWFFGRYGFVLRNARPLEFKPCVGQLGFFTPDYTKQYAIKPPKKERPVKPAKPAPVETLKLF